MQQNHNATEPSYRNESSDSVSRKPLHQFKNAFDTKYIDLFNATFVTTVSLNTTIHSINQINLSSFIRAWVKGPTAEVESSQGRIYPT